MTELLQVNQLCTRIRGEKDTVTVVDDVSLTIAAGETLGLVGESGSGKSMTALSIMGLLPQPDSYVAAGELLFLGRDMRRLNSRELANIRGNSVSMIFQDPMTALNPVQKIGRQIAEVLWVHRRAPRSGLRARVIELLDAVGLPDPVVQIDSYPHQLSGGMRQRVMIAMALACEPQLLIADEPTTALDVTVQAQILQLIKRLQGERDMALLFITHDLALISRISDRIAVMYAGQIVETANTATLFKTPRHPYTRALLTATPAAATEPKTRLPTIPGAVARPGEYGELCRFLNRCEHAGEICRRKPVSLDDGVRCLRWRELPAAELPL